MVASTALFSAGSPPVRTDQNTDIKFGPVTLTHVTDKGEAIPVPDRQLYKGDWLYLNVDFDATEANPEPGQSFTIDLPEPSANRDGGNSRSDVIKPLECTDSKGVTVKAGECKVDESRITYTFGDAIGDKLNVAGKIRAQLLTLGATDKTSSVLTINGKEYIIVHLWNEDITLRLAVQLEPGTRLTKGARGVGINSIRINWRALLGGSWFKANYPNGGPVTATDVIQDGLEVPDPATIKLVEVQAGPDGAGETERAVATTDGKVKKDGYGIRASFEGKTVTFKMTGSLPTDKNYRIDFDTRLISGDRTVPDHEYHNRVHPAEANKDINVLIHSYFESLSVTISHRQGFGGLQVTKASAGSAIPPVGQKSDVTVAYKLPNGKTVADFPGWDALANPARITIIVGQTTPSVTLPASTEITLTKDVTTANSVANGTIWGDPKFSLKGSRVITGGDSRITTFIVADQTTPSILLTNNATRTIGEPPAPPAPDPRNPDPTDSADPGKSDPVDPSESAKVSKTVPMPMRPGLPRTGYEG